MQLSGLLGASVIGSGGDNVGQVGDVVALLDDNTYPTVTGIVVRVSRARDLFVPIREVAELSERATRLATSRIDVRPFRRRDGEILLGRDLLDTELVDLDRGRLSRANELRLELDGGLWRVVAVDFGLAALAKRVGIGWLFGGRARTREVPWDRVDLFASQIPSVRLDLRHDKIARLHPSDIAQIVEDLPRPQSAEIVAALDQSVLADAVEDLEPERGLSLLQSLDEERAADLLEEISDDAAADLLGDIEPELAEQLLSRMDQEDAAAVRSLLDYPDDSAGGLMTTEFVTFGAGTVAGAALDQLRAADWLPDHLNQVYLVEEDGRFGGVVAFSDLVLGSPDSPLADLLRGDPVFGHPEDSPEEVARTIARYHLPALPILDDLGRLVGIVTADDAMAVLLPADRRPRLPRIFG